MDTLALNGLLTALTERKLGTTTGMTSSTRRTCLAVAWVAAWEASILRSCST